MFIDDEKLAERSRRADPYPALIIVITTLAACLLTAASALSQIA